MVSTHSFTIEPDFFTVFEDDEQQIAACKDWGLLSEKATKMKAFSYKRNGVVYACSIIGWADKMTAVIELDNGQRHSIHPSYLKEMQAAAFGQKTVADPAASTDQEVAEAVTAAPAASIPESASSQTADSSAIADKPKTKAKKEKPAKLQLPEEKVKMSAVVQQFTTVPNHFSDTDDEVIIYESVVVSDPAIEIGTAWSSHSATLKKLELQIGDALTFEAKIAAKKLTKHPVPYKINNPSKIQKQ